MWSDWHARWHVVPQNPRKAEVVACVQNPSVPSERWGGGAVETGESPGASRPVSLENIAVNNKKTASDKERHQRLSLSSTFARWLTCAHVHAHSRTHILNTRTYISTHILNTHTHKGVLKMSHLENKCDSHLSPFSQVICMEKSS